jgi:hypothetical protein
MAALALEHVYLHTLFDKASCQIISELRKISFDENGENVTKLETKDDFMSEVITKKKHLALRLTSESDGRAV